MSDRVRTAVPRGGALALALLLITGCGAGPAASQTPPGSAAREPPASLAPAGSTTDADPSRLPAASSVGAGSPAATLDRATGSGWIEVDGNRHDVEVVVCGWSGGASGPLQAAPGGRQSFYLVAARTVGAGLVYLELDWDGDVGFIDVTTRLVNPADPASAFSYANDRQPSGLVEIEELRAVTADPLTVYDGQNVMTATAHDLGLDVTCDTAGGRPDQAAEALASALGLTVPSLDTGQVIVNGVTHPVEVARCTRLGDAVEIEAASVDGPISLTLLAQPDSTFLVLSVEGRVLTLESGLEVDLEIDGETVRTMSPIRGEIAGRGPAEVLFELPCA